jgi:hypothetical protein
MVRLAANEQAGWKKPNLTKPAGWLAKQTGEKSMNTQTKPAAMKRPELELVEAQSSLLAAHELKPRTATIGDRFVYVSSKLDDALASVRKSGEADGDLLKRVVIVLAQAAKLRALIDADITPCKVPARIVAWEARRAKRQAVAADHYSAGLDLSTR